MNATVTPAVEIKPVLPVGPDFGKGRYSSEMQKYYLAMQALLGISDKAAEKIARQMGSDAGAISARMTAEIKVGRSGKDGKVTFKDIASAKGVTGTNALNIVHAVQWIDTAGKNGISYGFTKWHLDTALHQYVLEVEADVKKAG